jgi:arylsulfatase A-like enzyme
LIASPRKASASPIITASNPARRAAQLSSTGSVPVRTGMTKVGLPGAKEGWQKSHVTMATLMKSLGYATGQFGKNHQGDLDEHLPTIHGFDEFVGSLYHLNAEEEPENLDYPKDPELARAMCSSARPMAREARPSKTPARLRRADGND